MILGNMFFFQDEQREGQLPTISANTIVHILGGPVCQGSTGNILRWYVRVIDGPRAGVEGWIAEGDTDERQMEPIRGE